MKILTKKKKQQQKLAKLPDLRSLPILGAKYSFSHIWKNPKVIELLEGFLVLKWYLLRLQNVILKRTDNIAWKILC